MANPLKVLTDLIVSGSTSTSGSLTISGNGSLYVGTNEAVKVGRIGSTNFSITGSTVSASAGFYGDGSHLTNITASSMPNFSSDVLAVISSDNAILHDISGSSGVKISNSNGYVTASLADTVAGTGLQFNNGVISMQYTGSNFGSTFVALGSTANILQGLTTVTASNFVGSLIGNANTATTASTLNTTAISTGLTGGNGTAIAVSGASGLSSGKLTKWNGTAFTNSLVSEVGSAVTVDAGLTVGGNTNGGSLTIKDSGATTVASIDANGDTFVRNLTVAGTASIAYLQAVSGTAVQVGEKIIAIASGSTNASQADGAGFTIGTSSSGPLGIASFTFQQGDAAPDYFWIQGAQLSASALTASTLHINGASSRTELDGLVYVRANSETYQYLTSSSETIAGVKFQNVSGALYVLDNQLSGAVASATTLSGTVSSMSGTLNSVSGTVSSTSGTLNSVSGTVSSISGTLNSVSGALVNYAPLVGATFTGGLTASAGIDVTGSIKLANSDVLKAGTKNADIVVAGGGGTQTVTTHITGTLHVSGSGESYLGVGLVNADGFGAIGEGVYGYGKNGLVLQGGGVGFQIAALDGGGMGGVTIGAYSTSGETITLTGSAGKITLEDLLVSKTGSVTKVAYYAARNVATASNNFGTTSDVIFNFKLMPGKPEGHSNNENWDFHAITGLSGATQAACLDAVANASIDVMTRDNGASSWTNDLVSIKVEAEQTSSVWYPKITVSAPALTVSADTKIRLIIVNESQSSLN